MRPAFIILFVFAFFVSHSQDKKSVQGKWLLVSSSDIEYADESSNTFDSDLNESLDTIINSQLGKVEYYFLKDSKFQYRNNDQLTVAGTYVVDYKISKIVLGIRDRVTSNPSTEEFKFLLRGNYLILFIPENSSTLKLTLKKIIDDKLQK